MSTALARLRAIIVAHDPTLAGARCTLHERGWDSLAVEVDGRLIFKFPRDEEGAAQLAKEARLLDLVRRHVTMRVPELVLLEDPEPFTRHEKIPGEHLLREDYARLDEPRRERLAAELARFFAELHAIPVHVARAHGAEDPEPSPAVAEIERGIARFLSPGQRARAARLLAEWEALPSDPIGEVFGYFDGHGWNMAFDHAGGTLTGIYDFGDAGIDQAHHEFIAPSFVDPDLTERVITHYERAAGRPVDRRRVALATGALRLVELAEDGDEPAHGAQIRDHAAEWLASFG